MPSPCRAPPMCHLGQASLERKVAPLEVPELRPPASVWADWACNEDLQITSRSNNHPTLVHAIFSSTITVTVLIDSWRASPEIKDQNCHPGLALTGRDVVGRATALVGREMALVGRDMMRSQVVDLPWSRRLPKMSRQIAETGSRCKHATFTI